MIIPPGEKPPPYDFSEVHGGLTSDDVQSSGERMQSTAIHSSETRSTQTQPVTLMDPYHVSPVFIPVGGVSISGAEELPAVVHGVPVAYVVASLAAWQYRSVEVVFCLLSCFSVVSG